MKTTLIILCVLVFLALIFAFVKQGSRSIDLPYSRVEALFTPAEQSFFKVLLVAAAEDYLVLGKVRVADLVQPTIKRGGKGYLAALNKVAQKHIDFVLCHPLSFSPICVVELNDKSHQASDRKSRDLFLTRVFAKVGLPCVWIAWKRDYDPIEIRKQIEVAISTAQKLIKT